VTSITDTTTGNGTAPTTTPALRGDDITVRFGGVTALANVSLTVPPSTIVGLVGPNGAGKSTMFAALSGLIRPNTGRVYLAGQDVTHATPQTRAHMGLARTFQQVELFLGLTVEEHLILAHRVRYARRRLWSDLLDWRGFRSPDQAETDHVETLLEMLGLNEVASEPVAGLPLGIARRVEMGRALACSPTVLLLDEPFSGLDVHESEQVLTGLVRTVREHNVSLLLVEHDVEIVLGVSSSVYVLDFGVLIASGRPENIRNNEIVKTAYLGGELTTLAPAGSQIATGEDLNAGTDTGPTGTSPPG
jgi:ABC-type branched-subunit amino acid transport system ATPase component